MKVTSTWKEKLVFTSAADSHSIEMDTKAPLGSDTAMTPKQLVVAGLSGCTAMDVISLLKKYRQSVETFGLDAEVELTEGAHPIVFKKIHLTFRLSGQIEPEKLLEAVRLSQTKFCGVSAMLSKAVPMDYSVELNGTVIGTGAPDFK